MATAAVAERTIGGCEPAEYRAGLRKPAFAGRRVRVLPAREGWLRERRLHRRFRGA
ncbi:MAG TPA: hypothetical protein VME19_14240 [Streptosporangiaceae bacterium]|nr:hypothetical protein [Streptosporangiaceae bacterium]